MAKPKKDEDWGEWLPVLEARKLYVKGIPSRVQLRVNGKVINLSARQTFTLVYKLTSGAIVDIPTGHA